MLRLIGSHYHFRRAIPQDLKALLGRSEISLSLRTDKKLIVRERAADLYARTGDFFHKARTLDEQASPTFLQELLALQTQMIRDQETTLSLAEECHALEQKAEKARHAMEMLAQVQKESAFLQQSRDHLAAIQTRLESLNQRLKTGSAVSTKEKEMLRGEANRLAAMIVDIRSNQALAQQAGNLPASSPPLLRKWTQKKSLPQLNRPLLACLSWPKNSSIQTPPKAPTRSKPLVRPLICLLRPSATNPFDTSRARWPVSSSTFCPPCPLRMAKEKLFSPYAW